MKKYNFWAICFLYYLYQNTFLVWFNIILRPFLLIKFYITIRIKGDKSQDRAREEFDQ